MILEVPITNLIQNEKLQLPCKCNKPKCTPTPTPTPTHYHNKRRKRSILWKKINSVSIMASINKSFVKCRHHLVEFLSDVARMVTPTCSAKGFEILTQDETNKLYGSKNNQVVYDRPSPSVLVLTNNNLRLPPLVSSSSSEIKGTIVLDLDETLVHSILGPAPPRYDFMVSRDIDGTTVNFYVLKRPGVDEFLEMISKKYEVVVFTAGHVAYASKVLDILDPKGLISHRFYRDSCKQVRGKFIKDLSGMGRDMRKIVIVDDNPNSFTLQPENGIPIKPFLGDEPWDNELMKLAGFFERCDVCSDMRDAVKKYLELIIR